MSHTLGTTGSTTITTTAVQHQPPTASTSGEHTIRATGGKVSNFASGGDHPATVVSLEQRKFYDHSLPVGLEGSGFSTSTTVAPHIQPSTERSAPAPGHNTVGIGIGNSGEVGGGRVAPISSTTSALGEVQPTLAASTMLPSAPYSTDASIAPSRNWSVVTTMGPHTNPPLVDTMPSPLGRGVSFGQKDAVGGQQYQQQQQQQQQWFGGPEASLDPSRGTAMATRSPLSNVPFPPPNQAIPQPAFFQSPQPHLPVVSSANCSNGATNPAVSHQYGLLPPSGQFSHPGGGGNPSGLAVSAAFGAGPIGLPTLASQPQPSPYGVIPNIPMFASPSPFGGGLEIRGPVDGGGFVLPAVTTSNVGTNIGFVSGGVPGGIIDGNSAGSQPLIAGQTTPLQLTAPMFTVSAPLQSVFTLPSGPISGVSVVQPQAMVHPATAAATAAAVTTAGAGVPTVPFPVNSFLQLNPLYPGLKQLLQSPPVYMVDNFFTSAECDALMALANNYMIISPVVGAGTGEISESRTSSSCFLAREDLPTVCSKVMALTGKPLQHLELPQDER